jgi:hypothetical protein
MKYWEIIADTIMRGDNTFWIAILGAITGVLGFGLDLWNAWVTWRQHRIRLRVVPVTLLSFSPEGEKLARSASSKFERRISRAILGSRSDKRRLPG